MCKKRRAMEEGRPPGLYDLQIPQFLGHEHVKLGFLACLPAWCAGPPLPSGRAGANNGAPGATAGLVSELGGRLPPRLYFSEEIYSTAWRMQPMEGVHRRRRNLRRPRRIPGTACTASTKPSSREYGRPELGHRTPNTSRRSRFRRQQR